MSHTQDCYKALHEVMDFADNYTAILNDLLSACRDAKSRLFREKERNRKEGRYEFDGLERKMGASELADEVLDILGYEVDHYFFDMAMLREKEDS